ncbi:hypothetical protein Q4E40_02810 [Pontibacter sp. BT731]|uniref:hypothetical protein n=1 Tax=Pontibacter coccineus TaxID=3063328 RepID=UPI0026E3355C|nr:hypothetical protein [Pontibacter sp. BT731]MDO6389044.1 hypothetical protein [Pontibacter sp. BT731]
MKFTVEVEIDWIDEETGLNEAVSGEIKSRLADKVYKHVEKQLADKISKDISSSLDAQIQKTYEEFMEKSFTIYDQWGDPKKENVSVKSLLKEKLDNFLTERVDDNGKPTGYGGKVRYEQILDKQSQKQINDFLSQLSAKVIAGIKNDINEQAVERITKGILSDYSLKKLVNPLNG